MVVVMCVRAQGGMPGRGVMVRAAISSCSTSPAVSATKPAIGIDGYVDVDIDGGGSIYRRGGGPSSLVRTDIARPATRASPKLV